MKHKILFILFCYSSFLVNASDTELKLYRPFGETMEQVSPRVKNQFSGLCSAPSKLMIREDAWRCLADGKTYDPCFVDGANKTHVVCPLSPWTEESIQINVSKPLVNEEAHTIDMSRNFPWAIELANGERCQAVTATELYDSMPIRYRCATQNVLLGSVQRCKPVWSMLEKTPQGVITVDLKRAWF